MVKTCRICQSVDTNQLTDKCNGYIEGTFYNVFHCNTCSAHFTDVTQDNKNLFDEMYETESTHAYGRYFKYADAVLDQKDPLTYLANHELPYFAAKQLVSEYQTCASILDVGSGLGYLTYAIACRGHEVLGIDISRKACAFAEKRFGTHYYRTDIFNLSTEKKFDMIIALEVIESSSNPTEFIQAAMNILKPDGKLLLTFPNKDFYHKRAVWLTVPPPLNTIWLNKKAFHYMGQQINAPFEFIQPKIFSLGRTNLAALRFYYFIKKEVFSDHFIKQRTPAKKNSHHKIKDHGKKIISAVLKNGLTLRIMNSIYLKFQLPLPTIALKIKKL